MNEPTVFQRVEKAWHLATDLMLSVDHFWSAMEALTDGDLLDAHWEFWRGGFTKIQPFEQEPLPLESTVEAAE